MKFGPFIKRTGVNFYKRLASVSQLFNGPVMESALTFSEKEFLKEVNLKQVSSLLEKDDVITARKALLSHYKDRVELNWPIFPSRMTKVYDLGDSELIEQADLLAEHRFLIGDEPEVIFGEKIDWKYNPTLDPRARWTRELHRHRWWSVLAVAYQKTSDERYAREFVNVMIDWVKNNPPPPNKNEGDVVWTLMGVGMRCVIWTSAFPIFYRSEFFSDEAKLLMLRSLYDHAQYLALFKTENNHLLRESNGLAYIGVYFPEFRKAEHWRKIAFERLESALIEQVNTDGSHFEVSPAYQWLAVEEFQATLDLLKASNTTFNHVDLSDYLAKMYRMLAYISRPDGSMPQLNDGFMEHKDLQLRQLVAAGNELNYQDIVYIATQGKEGSLPTKTSIEFEHAGLYVMRSDWSEEARYLIFDCGPFGGPHGHEDKLSIEVFAYGQPLIIDPGSYTYNVANPYRNFFVSSRSHNTLVVAGKSQIRRLNKKNLDPKTCLSEPAQWKSCEAFDFVRADYSDGYGDYEFWKQQKTGKHSSIVSNVVHTRCILFVKPDYWLMIDKVYSSEPLDYEILFHCAPNVNVEMQQNKSVDLCAGNAWFSLIPLSQDRFDTDVSIGSETPIQGWYSDGRRNHKVPAPAIIFKLANSKTTIFATLLYPCKHKQELDTVTFEQHHVDGSEAYGYVVTTCRGRDFVIVSSDMGLKKLEAFETSGLVAIQRTDLEGGVLTQWEWMPEGK